MTPQKRAAITNHARRWTEFDFSRLRSGPLYFYVGAGLSMAAGLVGWDEMACMVWRHRKYYEGEDSIRLPSREARGTGSTGRDRAGRTDPTKDYATANAEFLQEFMDKKGTNRQPILSHGSKDTRTFGRTVLLNLMLRRRAPRTRFIEKCGGAQADSKLQPDERSRYGHEPMAEDFTLQSLVWRTNCHGVLTPNYDMFLEHAHSLFHHGSALRSYRYNASFLPYIFSNPAFVLKLHGDINDIGTMLLDPKQLWSRKAPHQGHPRDLREVYSTALENGHMVYVGVGFRDETIKQLHKYWKTKDKGSPYLRVALLPSGEFPDIGGKALFEDIAFLTYETTGGDNTFKSGAASHAVRQFLSRLVETRRHTHERPRYEEATEIHRQMFEAFPEDQPTRRFETDRWSTASRRKK